MKRIVAAAATCLYLAGCGNLNSVYRDFDTRDGTGAMIDIKQRAIVVGYRSDGHGPIVCAEPSPDALSAYAAEAAGEANVPGQVGASVAAAAQESAAFVGLRTQSIQLLRDNLYRLCEGYLNGAIDESEYAILMRRYQRYMVALLGLEQLAGAVRVPPVVLTTEGQAEAARSLSIMRDELRAIETQIAALEQRKGLEGASDEERAAIQKEIAALTADKNAVNSGIANARGLLASGSTSGSVFSMSQGVQHQDTEPVVQAIESIVLKVVQSDDLGQACLSMIRYDIITDSHPLYEICEKRLNIVLHDLSEEGGPGGGIFNTTTVSSDVCRPELRIGQLYAAIQASGDADLIRLLEAARDTDNAYTTADLREAVKVMCSKGADS